MSPLTETIFFVFGLVALGYVSGWTGLLKTAIGDALTAFAVAIAVPMLLFRTLIEADFQGSAPLSLWACYFFAVAAAWACGQFVTQKVFGRDARAGVVGGVSAAFSNLVLLGLPLVQGVFGRPGLEVLSLIVAVHLPIMMAMSIALFEWANRNSAESAGILAALTDFLRKLVSNPLIVGILAALIWRLTGFEMPSLGMRFVDALANAAGPLALFAMGLSLRRMGISGNVKAGLALSAVKLFVMPVVALGAVLVIGLPPLAAMVVVTAAALPAGVNPYLIATRFGTGQALASNVMTISTLVAAGSSFLWLAVAQRLFG
ncbi:AEC family transporter [Mesorhizobium sp. YIM 152430]|uniref:AEC family transporter n=1 Tax=Mesorhizobium sp. YIM 152430 TaxID=3031761 RepID=UPI0023DCD01A|nr:AEC family transporter [Mesorhizobium sp. YIM 152430]MDF1599776.1 AEC family transporter [Mesorhizobium sp. YIM 152430]